MKTECAINFNTHLNDTFTLLEAAYEGYLHKVLKDENQKKIFDEVYFLVSAMEFQDEIIENLNTYDDEVCIIDYIEFYIDIEKYITLFKLENFNRVIMSRNEEVEFILKIKKSFDRYVILIDNLRDLGSNKLIEIWQNGKKDLTHTHLPLQPDENNDLEFDFDAMKWKAASYPVLEQLRFWVDLKFYFQQWRKKSSMDVVFKFDSRSPHFESRCTSEIERLEKLLEIEKRYGEWGTSAIAASPLEETLYEWNGSDTDLLELICSLHELNLIGRKDKKEATRKELIDFFTELFDREIKDPHSKLSKTVHRKKGEPNILERMVKSYSDYNSRKLERGRGGKK